MQNAVLLLISYIFYAAYDIWLMWFLVIITFIVYFLALQITRHKESPFSRIIMNIGVVICLCPLVFYKYLNFLVNTFIKTIGYGNWKQLDYVVPFGISFIVFSLISYLIDVYRGTILVERNPVKFALFVSFFPKVAQGPIERAGDILPQFDEKHYFNLCRFREGMMMVIYGLFMKMVVADNIGVSVDTIYKSLTDYTGAAILIATVLFMIQIYCDFAGYSFIAVGSARVLGFDFKQNFRQPYFALSVTEFWRRWHISLNRWLTDYLYIPLGGSRCSKVRHKLNIMVTFIVSGLWHGAAGGYIVWGFLNGAYVVFESACKDYCNSKNAKGCKGVKSRRNASACSEFFIRLLRRILVFISIMFSWIFFRAQRCNIAIVAIKRIFTSFELRSWLVYVKKKMFSGAGTTLYGLDVVYGIPSLLIGILIVWGIDLFAENQDLYAAYSKANRFVRWTICYVLIFAVIIWGAYGYGYNASDFIYATF